MVMPLALTSNTKPFALSFLLLHVNNDNCIVELLGAGSRAFPLLIRDMWGDMLLISYAFWSHGLAAEGRKGCEETGIQSFDKSRS